MKKWIAVILALMLSLTAVFAAAEESAQAALEQAFVEKLAALLSQGSDHAITLSAVTPEGEAFFAQTLPAQDAQGGALMDFTLRAPGLDTPLRAQFGQEAAWVQVNGTVYEVRYAEWMDAFSQALSFASSSAMPDPAVYSEMFTALAQAVLLPGLTVEQGEDTLVLRLSLTAEQVLSGLAAFGDQLVANEAWLGALKPLDLLLAAQAPGSGSLTEALVENWPQLKAQLLSTQSDLALEALFTARSAEDVFSLDGQASLNTENGVLVFTLNHRADSATFRSDCALRLAREEETITGITLRLRGDRDAGLFTADLALPQMQQDVSLAVSVSEDGAFQAHLTVLEENTLITQADLTGLAVRDGLTVNCAVTANEETVSATLFWSAHTKSLTVNSQGQTLKAQLLTDESGHFTASLILPNYQGEYRLEGTVEGSAVHATLTYTDPRMAARGMNYTGFTAEITLAGNSRDFSAQVTVNTYRATADIQLQWSPAVKSFSLQSGEQVAALRILQDEEGRLLQARLITPEADVLYTADPALLTYRDHSQTVTCQAAFESETAHLITVQVLPLGESVPQVYTLRTVLEEAQDGGQIVSTLARDGQTGLTLTCAVTPAEGTPELLSEAEPLVHLTVESLQPLMQQLMAQ